MAKLQDILGLAEFEAKVAASSPQDWMRYLDTASRLYRYPFSDTLLIHAQRRDTTACAELEVWNEKMMRWVNRGAKGIALIDDTGPRRRLRYVFDISDTHMVRGGRTPYLWQVKDTHKEMLLDHLADTYGLAGADTVDLQAALMAVAADMADENLEEAMEGLEYEIRDTFLEGLDADTIRVEFRNLLRNSTFYSLSRRCGLDPMEYLEEADFFGITDFNSLSVLAFLGNATSQIVEPVLRDIGRTIRQAEYEEQRRVSQKELEKPVAKEDGLGYNEFSTLIRESENSEGGIEDGTDLPPQGGLPVPEPDHRERGSDDREIRDAAQDIPEGTPEELVSEYDADREAEQAPDGDRESGAGEGGNTDGWASYDLSGTGQGSRPDEVDGAHEYADGDGGGDRADGIGVQLTEETKEQDLSEAEEEISSALSLPELPSAKEQIRSIEERQAALYAGEIAIPPEVVDELRGADYDPGHPLTVEEHVAVNHAATILTAVPITIPEQGDLRLGDGLNFTGGEQTIPKYLQEMAERNIEADREIMGSAIGRNNENLYLSGTEERYAIYQIKDNSEDRGYRFMGLDFVTSHGMVVDAADYAFIYGGRLSGEETLDSLYEKFNLNHPAGYQGHSLSVSDVVVMQRDGQTKAYYVDSFGFKELPDFVRQRLHEAEMNRKREDSAVTLDTSGIEIEQHEGLWHTADKREIADEIFYLMEHNEYGDSVAAVIVNADGELVAQELENGFDRGAMEAIHEYLAGKGIAWEPEAEGTVKIPEQKQYPPVYRYPLAYATEHGAADEYLDSRKLNIDCKKAVEEAIRSHFDGLHLAHDAVDGLLQKA